MATLHLMIGLPCSGKTTRARQLESRHGALRLTPDEWQLELFGNDIDSEAHDGNHDRVEALMWQVAERVLTLGVDVILDFGCWSRAEREDFRARAAALGADFRLHYMDVAEDELVRRLHVRNAQAPPGTFVIPEAWLRGYMALFEPPAADELR